MKNSIKALVVALALVLFSTANASETTSGALGEAWIGAESGATCYARVPGETLDAFTLEPYEWLAYGRQVSIIHPQPEMYAADGLLLLSINDGDSCAVEPGEYTIVTYNPLSTSGQGGDGESDELALTADDDAIVDTVVPYSATTTTSMVTGLPSTGTGDGYGETPPPQSRTMTIVVISLIIGGPILIIGACVYNAWRQEYGKPYHVDPADVASLQR